MGLRKRTIKLLEELEFSLSTRDVWYCPLCSASAARGHYPDCRMRTVLKDLRDRQGKNQSKKVAEARPFYFVKTDAKASK